VAELGQSQSSAHISISLPSCVLPGGWLLEGRSEHLQQAGGCGMVSVISSKLAGIPQGSGKCSEAGKT
jgi:hypothetical protein